VKRQNGRASDTLDTPHLSWAGHCVRATVRAHPIIIGHLQSFLAVQVAFRTGRWMAALCPPTSPPATAPAPRPPGWLFLDCLWCCCSEPWGLTQMRCVRTIPASFTDSARLIVSCLGRICRQTSGPVMCQVWPTKHIHCLPQVTMSKVSFSAAQCHMLIKLFTRSLARNSAGTRQNYRHAIKPA
jgi:hypothetical protein